MVVFMGIILAALIFRWATDWFGARGGLLALGVFVFDPNILAHSRLATLDLGVTMFVILTLYTLQRTLKRPGYTKLCGTGVWLGLALASKISTVILLPIAGVQLLVWGLPRWKPKQLLGYSLTYFGTAFLALWAVHLLQTGHVEGIPFTVPAPTYLRALFRIGQHVTGEDRRAFLLGQTYIGGHWAYFPVAFLLKTPIPVLLLFGIEMIFFWKHLLRICKNINSCISRSKPRPGALAREFILLRPPRLQKTLWLALFPALYLLISITGEINIGYRHILPVVPFLYLSIAHLSGQQYRKSPPLQRNLWSRWLILLILGWQILGTVRIWPFHLTYFNELAGGPQNGYRYLADSNVDWGQGLKALKTYLEKQSLENARLSHFAYFMQPQQIYGIEAAPLPPASGAPAILPRRYNPEPGTYILSASSLRGLQGVDSEMYNWFWHREPDAVVANAMLVYTVTEPVPDPTWIAQCTAPVTPLSPQAITDGFGSNPWRLLSFDCLQGWLYPAAGKSRGWLVISGHLFKPQTLIETGLGQSQKASDDFVNRRLANTRLTYQQKLSTHLSPYTIYESHIPPELTPTDVYASPAENPPDTQTAPATAAPITFDETLTFLQALAYLEDEAIDVETWWQVDAGPISRPLSIMAHLLTPTGEVLGIADGLSVSPSLWGTGDIIVQRHRFTVSTTQSLDTYLLRTGVYWLDTQMRWNMTGHPNADAIFVYIQPD